MEIEKMCKNEILGYLLPKISDSKVDGTCNYFESLYLWVLHDALDAVKVGELIDRLAGIIQESSDSLNTNRDGTKLNLNGHNIEHSCHHSFVFGYFI